MKLFTIKLRITAAYCFASGQALARAAPNCPPVTRLHPQTPCQSLTSRWDSGSDNFSKPSSLCAIA
ncbi:hypothetical protein EHR02_00165 [Leptospira levettii]|nr:hypothetical protein EHR02_00165 [Leptospira levettii]